MSGSRDNLGLDELFAALLLDLIDREAHGDSLGWMNSLLLLDLMDVGFRSMGTSYLIKSLLHFASLPLMHQYDDSLFRDYGTTGCGVCSASNICLKFRLWPHMVVWSLFAFKYLKSFVSDCFSSHILLTGRLLYTVVVEIWRVILVQDVAGGRRVPTTFDHFIPKVLKDIIPDFLYQIS